MFTGLVEAEGILRSRTPRGPGARLDVICDFRALVLGESVAVQGVCLTVDRITSDGFQCDASAETLQRTTLGALPLQSKLNLERAMPLGGRMGGHIVTGHVDATAQVRDRRVVGETHAIRFGLDGSLARFVASKGSVAVDGVSLTVNGVGGDWFDVVVIPHTLSRTTLSRVSPGTLVNVEVDLLARYVARILESGGASARSAAPEDALLSKLKTAGYL